MKQSSRGIKKVKRVKSKGKGKNQTGWLAFLAVLFLLKFTLFGGELLGFEYKGLFPNAGVWVSHIEECLTGSKPSEASVYMADGSEFPAYSGSQSVVVNGNKPFFTVEDLNSIYGGVGFEYSGLDVYGRSGVAKSVIGVSTLVSSEERRGIDLPEPSGWVGRREGGIYDRSHLIAFTFGGSNELNNLVTGTVSLNQKYMVEVENDTREYIKSTGRSVLYRVTPYFMGVELVPRGVLMEVSSSDSTFTRCVYIHNIQDGFSIDYGTGKVAEVR